LIAPRPSLQIAPGRTVHLFLRPTTQRDSSPENPPQTSLDTASRVRLFRRRHMNLPGTTLASLLAHTSVVVASVVSVSASVVTTAPRGF